MINEEKMDNLLLELGHDDFNRGTAYTREAVVIWDEFRAQKKAPVMLGPHGIYTRIAANHDSTPARVERCIRHSIGKAWNRGDWETQCKYFGSSVDPAKGKPTNGEYIARLARMCALED